MKSPSRGAAAPGGILDGSFRVQVTCRTYLGSLRGYLRAVGTQQTSEKSADSAGKRPFPPWEPVSLESPASETVTYPKVSCPLWIRLSGCHLLVNWFSIIFVAVMK